MNRRQAFVLGLGLGSLVPAAVGLLTSWKLRTYIG